MDQLSVTLHRSKETKRTYRFDAEASDAPVQSLYVAKRAFGGGTIPERVVLRLEEEAAAA